MLVERDLPLTSSWLSGAIPEKMSIPVILLKGTVGKLRRLLEDMFDIVEEDIFPRSLTGATTQDGGTRERRDDVTCVTSSS